MKEKNFTFKNQYDKNKEKYFTKSGKGEKTTFSPAYDENGTLYLKESGKENLYDYIQSGAESVDIHSILRRCSNGDTSGLQSRIGHYGDFTTFPRTFAGMLDKVNEGRVIFDSLPLDVRDKFGHSFTNFIASLDRPDFFDLIGFEPKTEPSVEIPVVTPVETPVVES